MNEWLKNDVFLFVNATERVHRENKGGRRSEVLINHPHGGAS